METDLGGVLAKKWQEIKERDERKSREWWEKQGLRGAYDRKRLEGFLAGEGYPQEAIGLIVEHLGVIGQCGTCGRWAVVVSHHWWDYKTGELFYKKICEKCNAKLSVRHFQQIGFIPLACNKSRVLEFGAAWLHMLPFWDWQKGFISLYGEMPYFGRKREWSRWKDKLFSAYGCQDYFEVIENMTDETMPKLKWG